MLQVHFRFESQLVASDNVFPKAMQTLIRDLPIKELELAFVHGRWVRRECLVCSPSIVRQGLGQHKSYIDAK